MLRLFLMDYSIGREFINRRVFSCSHLYGISRRSNRRFEMEDTKLLLLQFLCKDPGGVDLTLHNVSKIPNVLHPGTGVEWRRFGR